MEHMFHMFHIVHDTSQSPCYRQGMSIEFLYTFEEINAEIAEFKVALRACAVNQEYVIGKRRYTRSDIAELRKTLEWLFQEKRKISGKSGPQVVVGVPAR